MTLKAKNIPIKQWKDFWLALFSLAAVTLVATRLWATGWTEDIYIVVYIAFIAALSGLALGFSRFPPWLSALFSSLYGIFTIGWVFGTTVQMDLTWRDRILNFLGWRLRIAIQQYQAGEAVTDPILFLTIVAVLIWILASISTFIIIRYGKAWTAILPLGFVLLLISQYDRDVIRTTRFLMTFLFLALLIIGRIAFLRNKRQWQQEGIHTTTENHLDLSRTLLIIATIILVIAWIIPLTHQQVSRYSQLWDRITEPWDRLTQNISDIFVSDQPSSTSSSAFYGESMALGSGTPSSEDFVMTIHAETNEVPGYRNYWRARSYDYFNGVSWSTSNGFPSEFLFPDNFTINYPDWPAETTVTYTFTSDTSRLINLYTTGVPTWASRPVQAITQPISAAEQDLVALIADPNLISGEDYQIETRINIPTIYQLQNSGTEYPTWLDRYLQIPSGLSSNVATLASDIAGDLDNPYDITYAITRYLRSNIEYVKNIPPIPDGTNPIEWFLFEGKMGYCNYYATSEILMLRTLGIPARIGVGYAQGEYDDATNTYTVRRRDSHAWPEVYFVGYGWVTFEPTVAQPALILPAGGATVIGASPPNQGDRPLLDEPGGAPPEPTATPTQVPSDQTENIPGETNVQTISSRLIWTIFIIFLVLLAGAVVMLIRQHSFKDKIEPLPILIEKFLIKHHTSVPRWLYRWGIHAQMSIAEKAYRQMGRSIKILGEKPNPSQTPAERAQFLTELLPEASSAIQDILREYQLDKFSNHIVSEDRVRIAKRKLRRMSIRTRMRRFFSFGKSKK